MNQFRKSGDEIVLWTNHESAGSNGDRHPLMGLILYSMVTERLDDSFQLS